MIFTLFFTAALIALDQWSKYLAVIYLKGNKAVTVIPNFLGLRYIENTGAAFSMLSNSTGFLIGVTSVALLIMAYFIFIKKSGLPFERFCFILIFAGGVGNLIDRIYNGFVVDYFEFLFMDFAVFNVADVFVCTGIGLYTVYVFITEILRKKDS